MRTNNHSANLLTVSQEYPCELCGKSRACYRIGLCGYGCITWHEDIPNFVFSHDDRADFGFFYKVHDTGPDPLIKRLAKKRQRQSYTPLEWEGSWCGYLSRRRANHEAIERLAWQLGVSTTSLEQIGVGWTPEGQDDYDPDLILPERFLFPEMDADENVIGINARPWPRGEKRQIWGGRRGIVYDLAEVVGLGADDVLLIVEGASDVAAAMTIGLYAIGRPNNTGGADLVAELIRKHAPPGAKWVIVGENDQKEDGKWPGREGAIKVAGEVAQLLGQGEGHWCLPPANVKDLRGWLIQSRIDIDDPGQCRQFRDEVLTWVGRSSGLEGDEPPPKPSLDMEDFDALPESVQDVLAKGASRRPCPSHYAPHLQHKKNPRAALTLGVDCRRWSCVACAPRRKRRWLRHLVEMYGGQKRLWVARVLKEKWNAIRERLRVAEKSESGNCSFKNNTNRAIARLGADNVTIRLLDGRLLVVANAEFAEGEPACLRDAADQTAHVIDQIPRVQLRHINTSRGWALRETRMKSDYVRRGHSPSGSIEKVIAKLERDGMKPEVSETKRGKIDIPWEFPPHWTPEQRESYFDQLAGLYDGPPGDPPDGLNPFTNPDEGEV
jgi:hypothetical protein